MDFNKYKKYDIDNFILEEKFVQWVQQPDAENEKFWKEVLTQFPEKQQQINEARWIIKSMKISEPEIPSAKIEAISKKINNQNVKPGVHIGRILLRIAAIVVFLVSACGLLVYLLNDNKPQMVNKIVSESFDKGKIILPDGTVREFESKETKIQQTINGSLTINNETIEKVVENKKNSDDAMVQVIIPYGMRSQITLADGTHIWLNSGSQLSYPETFSGNSREVFLSGEAFFDVEANPSKPFYVITNDIKLRVLGTRFNVSSYNNDQTTQAVVVEGKISGSSNKLLAKSIQLNPGDRMVFTKSDGNIATDKVNINLYVSWIDGYLMLEREPIDQIFRKMERYYNKKIVMESSPIHTTFSGKLDLAEDIEKIFENISFTISLHVIYENEVYHVKY